MNDVQERQIKLGMQLVGIFIIYIFLCVMVCTNFFQNNKKREKVLVDGVATSGDFYAELYELQLSNEERRISPREYNKKITELYKRYNIEEEPILMEVTDNSGEEIEDSGEAIRNSDKGILEVDTINSGEIMSGETKSGE